MDNRQFPTWPGWDTVRLIGRGSFGAVYEIERDIFGEKEKAALKVITIPQNSSDIDELYGEGYDDESITSTFRAHLKSIVAEYSLMRKLNGSANVVNCDDVRYVQHEDGFGWDIFIKMELLTPLTKSLGKEAAEEQVIRIGTDIGRALVLCKRHNIIHRDIKPANIFVSENGDYKLGDFGIAKTVEKTSGGTKIGTYEYMAPEVYHDQPYGSTADIYSLGMVLYWLLNERRTPFLKLPPALPTNTEKEQARKRRFSGEAIPAPAHGSGELRRIVLKACAFDPKDRYQSADEMLRDLEVLRHPGAAPLPSAAEFAPEHDEEDEATVGSFGMSEGPATQEAELPADDEATVSVLLPSAPLQEQPDEDATVRLKIAEPDGTPEPDEDRTVRSNQTPVPAPAEPAVAAAEPAEPDDEATVGVFRKPPEEKPAAPAAPAPGKKNKKPLLFGGIVAALAILGVVLFLILGKSEPVFRVTRYEYTDNRNEYYYLFVYTYGDETGKLEQFDSEGYRTSYETLTLNKQGLIARADQYASDGTLSGYDEYEYDKYGNQTQYRTYIDGRLRQVLEAKYEQRVVVKQTRIYYDENGDETVRHEFIMTDREHGTYKIFNYGELTETRIYLRFYDGDNLVRQQFYDEDGNQLGEITFTRDEYGNVLKNVTSFPDGSTITHEYTYERVG